MWWWPFFKSGGYARAPIFNNIAGQQKKGFNAARTRYKKKWAIRTPYAVPFSYSALLIPDCG